MAEQKEQRPTRAEILDCRLRIFTSMASKAELGKVGAAEIQAFILIAKIGATELMSFEPKRES